MFSQESRCLYEANQLAEVICQLRFPEILAISANPPVEFQEVIRGTFPQYNVRQEVSAPKQPPVPNYQFVSPDGTWRINLTGKFISLTCNHYRCWEDFAKQLDKPLAAFIKLYRPAFFERIGLRYLNFFSRTALNLENVPYSRLLDPCWLGPLSQDDVVPSAVTHCGVDTQLNLKSGCRVKIHAGPGLVKRNGQSDPEPKFIFDMDLFMPGQVPVNHSAGALQTLHSQAFPIFRGAITDTLHDAMEPITI